MELILKIAWRNILRHKGKSIIIGIILFFGAFIMTAGNGVISGMDKGLQKHIVDTFSGDIVIMSTNQKDENVLTGGMSLKGKEMISGYTNIRELLKKQDYIKEFLPAGLGMATILNENGDMNFAFVYGVDFEKYQAMFHSNVVFVEGRGIRTGERGTLVTTGNRNRGYTQQGFWIVPDGYPLIVSNLSAEAMSNKAELDVRSNLVFMGMSVDSSQQDIKSSVKGVMKFRYLNNFWEVLDLMDIESFREAFGYLTAADSVVKISDEKKKILSVDENNMDALFGNNNVSEVNTVNSGFDIKKLTKRKIQTLATNIDIDNGAYNIVFVKLKNSGNMDKDLKKLNQALKDNHLDAKAVNWRRAAGQIGDFASLIKIALNVFVIFIFFVAVIVIMNTLAMAALERTNEIGMMRAVGAAKDFIVKMFSAETAILSMVFGGAGILVGAIAIKIVAAFHITSIDNDALQLFFGGDVFTPLLTFPDVLFGILELVIVTLVAMVYPILVARKITPLEAIARD
jgi:putative ABC transport system permease protein